MEPSISLFLKYKTLNKVTKYIYGKVLNVRQNKFNFKIWITLIAVYIITSILVVYALLYQSQSSTQLSSSATNLIETSCDSLSTTASPRCYDFRIFSCGIYGGAYEGHLTSFLLSEVSDSNKFISMDVGTSYECLRVAKGNGQLDIILDTDAYSDLNQYDKIGYFRKEQVKGFLVGHVHLDHIGGMLISSADDFGGAKSVISRPTVINQLYNEVWKAPMWIAPEVFEYYNVSINENNADFTDLSSNTDFNYKLKTYPLSHTVPSTAFLICNADETSCILYLSDTGPDPVENSNDLSNLWMSISSLVANGKLTTIFMECSYISSRDDDSLFGHLTPKWMLYELTVLAQYVIQESGASSIKDALETLSVIVTHIKPTFDIAQDTDMTRDIISEELMNPTNETYAALGVNFIIPSETAMIYSKAGKLTAIYAADSNGGRNMSYSRVLFVLMAVMLYLWL